jgi:hypothetical protein
MIDLLRELITDPLSYVVFLALGWGLKLYVERIVSGRVDTAFQKQLESHKHELEVAADTARFQLQERLAEFSLYVAKKHQVAAELYALFRIAHGRIYGLSGLRMELTFEEFNRDDISEYMTRNEVPKGKQDEILTLWDADKARAIESLRPYLRMLDIQWAVKGFAEAKNCAYKNELYLSDEAIARMNDLIDRLSELLAVVEHPPLPGETRPDKALGTAALEAFRDTLHAELAGSHSKIAASADKAVAPLK